MLSAIHSGAEAAEATPGSSGGCRGHQQLATGRQAVAPWWQGLALNELPGSVQAGLSWAASGTQ